MNENYSKKNKTMKMWVNREIERVSGANNKWLQPMNLCLEMWWGK